MRSILALMFIITCCASAQALVVIDPHNPDPRVALDQLRFTPGSYELIWNADAEWRAKGADVKVTDKPDPRIKKLPKLTSENAVFVVFRLDGPGEKGQVAAVIDESGGTGSGYDSGYIDSNRNWDLSDESSIYVRHDLPLMLFYSWSLTDAMDEVRMSDWVEVAPASGAGSERGTLVNITGYDLGDAQSRTCYVLRRGCWAARLRTNLGEVDLRLPDSNCDGIYGTTGDMLQINNVCLPDCSPVNLEMENTPAVRIGRQLFSTSTGNNRLLIRRYDGAAGTLRIVAAAVQGRGCSVREIRFTGDSIGRIDLVDCGNRSMELPEGSYHFESCVLAISNPGGESIHVSCVFDKNYTRRVIDNGSIPLVLGGNITSAVSPDSKPLVMKAGKTNDYHFIMKLGDAPIVSSIHAGGLQAPQVQFLDSGGKVVHTATSKFT